MALNVLKSALKRSISVRSLCFKLRIKLWSLKSLEIELLDKISEYRVIISDGLIETSTLNKKLNRNYRTRVFFHACTPPISEVHTRKKTLLFESVRYIFSR